MSAAQPRVLVTCVGSTNALSVIKALRAQSVFAVHVIGVDCELGCWTAGANFCDDYAAVPRIDTGTPYAQALAELVEQRSIDLLVPILDHEVELLGRHRGRFRANVLQLSPQETLEIGLDKLAADTFLRARGFDTPHTIDASDAISVRASIEAESPRFPVIAKPRRGCSSQDVYVLSSPRDLPLLDRIREPILQERLQGQEYTVDLFGDGDRVVACVPRRRLSTKAGQVYKACVDLDPVVIAESSRLATALAVRGPANVQGFLHGGRFRFVDINIRTSGGLPLTTAAGVNLPLMLLQLALGRPIAPVRSPVKLTMCRYWEEVVREHVSDPSS